MVAVPFAAEHRRCSVGGVTAELTLRPVATVTGGRTEIYEDNWGDVTAIIRLDSEQFAPDALTGVEGYSHLEVVFFFDQLDPARIQTGLRHPRNNPDWPLVGVFAHRGPYRPNRLGVSRCRLDRVDGLDLHVRGLDAVDGTPVLDIKPYTAEFTPAEQTQQPKWADVAATLEPRCREPS
ncbi:SAM-dependent methyltransferase [Streptomyces sp. A7024]|uniref:SAM-dependent methyltransferase n=1 Tax=Streptomyces coryli TaxID=1128680 RepID=A0A6G4TTW3_9ACTN|nr:SAM-dependent methyltransferase [Streptomyces coryli]NGN62431.1 SAM-dependent methyltransferase [Streptomyces coryli]